MYSRITLKQKMEGGNAMCIGLSLSFFIGSHSTSLFPLYLIPHCFSLSASSFISPSPFFSGFHTNSLSIFKSSSCHLFLSSIYTSAGLDLGVSKLVTPHFFFLLIFCSYCKALFVDHWICDFVHTVFFKNSFGLFLANLFFFLIFWF